MGIRGRVSRFISELIPPEERSTNPLIYRTVFLRIGLLTALSFMGSIAALLYSLADFREGDTAVALAELAVSSFLFAAPFVARKYRNIENLATVAIVLFGFVLIVAVFDELPEDRSSLLWLSVVPALSFILKGRKALFLSVAYLAIHLSLILFVRRVYVESLIDTYLSYAIITVILYFYAWMSERYREVWQGIAQKDNLTGLLNRAFFEELLNKEVERAKRYGEPLSLIIFDLDNFKEVNDTFGHLFGDMVLREVASMVAKNVRESDTVARWGGEEFIVLLPKTNCEQAVLVAQKLKEKVELCEFENGVVSTASFGVAELSREDDPVRLLLKADKALYEAKRSGKNKVVHFCERVNLK